MIVAERGAIARRVEIVAERGGAEPGCVARRFAIEAREIAQRCGVPLLSVVMPSLNQGRFLAEAVRSVLDQPVAVGLGLLELDPDIADVPGQLHHVVGRNAAARVGLRLDEEPAHEAHGGGAVEIDMTPAHQMAQLIRSGASADEAMLTAHCRSHIAGYKCPKSVVIADEALPRSGANKILKSKLRAAFRPEAGEGKP